MIKYFVHAELNTLGCNLKCDYCYLRQANHQNKDLPIVNVAFKEEGEGKVSMLSDIPEQEYLEKAKIFGEHTLDNGIRSFHEPPQYFCYAGAWSWEMNISTGWMWSCTRNDDFRVNFIRMWNKCQN